MRASQNVTLNVKNQSYYGTIRVNKKDFMADLSCTALLVFAFFPIFTALLGRLVNYIRYIAVLGFLLGVMMRDRKLFRRMVIILSLGFVFNLYYYYRLWKLFTTFPAFMAKSMLCWVYACFSLYYSKYGNFRGKKRIRMLWVFILIVTSITTIVSIGVDPLATRILGNANIYDSSQLTSLYMSNTASWGIMFGMVFTLPMWIARFKETRNPWYMAAIVVVTISTVMTQIMFAVIFAFIFLGCAFIRKLTVKKVLALTILIPLLMVVFQNVVGEILYAIYKNLDRFSLDVVKTRIYQIYMIFNMKQATGDASARMELYTNSLMTFLRSPLFGVQLVREDTNIIGMHSQILDIMGTTGLLGFFIYSGTFIYIARKTFMWIRDNNAKTFFIVSVLVLFLQMLVNPTWYTPEIYFAVFLLPFVIEFE